MYRKHFGFTHFPFDLELQPDVLFASNAITEAEARLKHLLELRAIGLITGEVGCGKTTACRKVASTLHPGLYRVFYVPLSTGNVMDMYKSIAWELGLPTERNRASAFRVIRAEITRLTLEAKQRPVLIVDEAQHLRNEVLEDLRLLTNYEMDSQNRLCLLLVGLTELRRRLTMAVHESLAQRIVVRYHLRGLEREELSHYLTHRLRLAGCELPLIEPPAIEALFQATQGMPRKVNRLAHYALTSAALTKAKSVTCEHVQAALEEIAP
ncbi:MAG: ExeA family protein [Gammaproteobacteria bacterium]